MLSITIQRQQTKTLLKLPTNFSYSNLDCRQKETPITSKTNVTYNSTLYSPTLLSALIPVTVTCCVSLSLSLYVLHHLFCLFHSHNFHIPKHAIFLFFLHVNNSSHLTHHVTSHIPKLIYA